MRCIKLTAFFLVTFALIGCERYALDRKMEEFCKKDGGVKVYEKIMLSPVEYDKVFNYVTKAKSQEDYYGLEYRYLSENKHLVGNDDDAGRGRGELIRHYSAIYRKSDDHLLGEDVWYTRVGGDFFIFGFQASSNSCPRPRHDLGQSIFSRGK